MYTINDIVEDQLAKVKKYISENEHRFSDVISILIDGSFVRGDFLEKNSDIDLTITVTDKHKSENEEIVQYFRELEVQLPKRDMNHKPLKYDIQWQSYSDVLKFRDLTIDQWDESIIPSGYPKLWLYAFDGIKNHRVIYGSDTTKDYTRIDPKRFIPIRINRLKNACELLKDTKSKYEEDYGGITQIKNAFEILRALYLSKGYGSINKYEVCKYYNENKNECGNSSTAIKLIKYILNQEIDTICNFRKELYEYSMKMIETYEKQDLTHAST